MSPSRLVLVLALAAASFGAPAAAQQASPAGEYPGLETGKMWTFDVPPLEYWARRYNFRPSRQWLDHVRLATVRIPGCTASFVSADGLIMTNHHCSRGCITAVSGEGEDLLGQGFLARSRDQERACAGTVVDQLLEISDVTQQVAVAVPAGTSADRAAALRDAAVEAIEGRCAAAENAFCQVIPMYRGGQYKLYRFRRYSDVRLVFAVEDQAASYGGDPDNFTYPRHDLDVTFMRVYEDGRPLRAEHFFRWSRAGSREGDLVFVTGNPGATNRLNTVAQLEYYRDVQDPGLLGPWERQIAVFQDLSRMSPERAAALRNQIFYLQNSFKAVTGYHTGLVDPQLMQRKREWEREFRQRVDADPSLRRQYGRAWDDIARVQQRLRAIDARLTYHSFGAYGTRVLSLAANLVRLPAESARPDSQRLFAYRDTNRQNLERRLYSPVPVDTAQEIRLLAAYFSAMASGLPANDPVRRQALGTRSPEEAARWMVTNSQILTADQRRALVQGGAAAVAASADPFVRLARVIDPLQRAVSAENEALRNEESRHEELVARALLAVYGDSVAPDATFSLRITDGEVRRYPYNGTFAAPFTTFHGLFDRHAGFSGEPPWNLSPRWLAARDRLDLATPLNGVSTNDITGGNSGSPLISRDAEIVGLVFDGNIEGLPLNYLFSEARGRTVWVDSRAIVEALRRVYDAGALADELLRGTP